MNNEVKLKKRVKLPREFYEVIHEYMWAVEKYTSLTNEDYDTDFYHAGQLIDELGNKLNRMMREAIIE